MLLKETIDRMRFDLDEMRNNVAAGAGGGAPGSGQSSVANTVSKSLGAELLGKMKGPWGGMGEVDDMDTEGMEDDEGDSSGTPGGDDTESEDVVQTIITRKKRVSGFLCSHCARLTCFCFKQKVASRAQQIETRRYEEVKEYSDSAIQYEPDFFTKIHSTQTDPEPKILTVSSSIQTEAPPAPRPATPPLPRVTMEMQIQTDDEPVSRSPSPPPSSSASSTASSSTLLPPTPKAAQLSPLPSVPQEQPPAYNQLHPDDDWRGTLAKWHPGASLPLGPVPGGLSADALEEWKALKEELGVDCLVIDKIVEESRKTGTSRASSSKDTAAKRSGRSRFYNIYNTYVYRDRNGHGNNSNGLTPLSQAAAYVAGTALVMIVLGPYIFVPSGYASYSIPGGPTYYDREAWGSFNTMQAAGEGFSPDGTAAVWSFLGRLGGGAARMVRGFPT